MSERIYTVTRFVPEPPAACEACRVNRGFREVVLHSKGHEAWACCQCGRMHYPTEGAALMVQRDQVSRPAGYFQEERRER